MTLQVTDGRAQPEKVSVGGDSAEASKAGAFPVTQHLQNTLTRIYALLTAILDSETGGFVPDFRSNLMLTYDGLSRAGNHLRSEARRDSGFAITGY